MTVSYQQEIRDTLLHKKWYKVLAEDGTIYGWKPGHWFPPAEVPFGNWMPAIDHPVLHRRGYHVVSAEGTYYEIGPALFQVEVAGDFDGLNTYATEYGVTAWSEARCIARILSWNTRTLRLFAICCAQRALENTGLKNHELSEPLQHILTIAKGYAEGRFPENTSISAKTDVSLVLDYRAKGKITKDNADFAVLACVQTTNMCHIDAVKNASQNALYAVEGEFTVEAVEKERRWQKQQLISLCIDPSFALEDF